jgi:hypothetical protein
VPAQVAGSFRVAASLDGNGGFCVMLSVMIARFEYRDFLFGNFESQNRQHSIKNALINKVLFQHCQHSQRPILHHDYAHFIIHFYFFWNFSCFLFYFCVVAKLSHAHIHQAAHSGPPTSSPFASLTARRPPTGSGAAAPRADCATLTVYVRASPAMWARIAAQARVGRDERQSQPSSTANISSDPGTVVEIEPSHSKNISKLPSISGRKFRRRRDEWAIIAIIKSEYI